MVGGFAGGDAAVMTARAIAHHFVVIDLDGGAPAVRVMTGFAAVAAGDMGAAFARCASAVMAADAV